MIKTLAIIILTILLGVFIPNSELIAQNSHQKQLLSKEIMETKTAKLRHVVLFSFKENASQEDIHNVEQAFSALPDKIPQIKDYEWGINNSPEGLNDGLTHCFLVTFDSEEDRSVYLPHPAHKAFVKILMPHLDRAVVVDYWANEK